METKKVKEGYSDIELELSDEEFCQLAKMAHERDITFNQMVEVILWDYIERTKKKIPTLTEEVKRSE